MKCTWDDYEIHQCPHEAIQATCGADGCNCPCDPCAPSRPAPASSAAGGADGGAGRG